MFITVFMTNQLSLISNNLSEQLTIVATTICMFDIAFCNTSIKWMNSEVICRELLKILIIHLSLKSGAQKFREITVGIT